MPEWKSQEDTGGDRRGAVFRGTVGSDYRLFAFGVRHPAIHQLSSACRNPGMADQSSILLRSWVTFLVAASECVQQPDDAYCNRKLKIPNFSQLTIPRFSQIRFPKLTGQPDCRAGPKTIRKYLRMNKTV